MALWKGPSPWVTIIRRRYEAQKLHLWDNERVWQLCRTVGCTVPELCAWAGETRAATVGMYLKEDRWPMHLTLHFFKLERFKSGLRGADVQDLTGAQLFEFGK